MIYLSETGPMRTQRVLDFLFLQPGPTLRQSHVRKLLIMYSSCYYGMLHLSGKKIANGVLQLYLCSVIMIYPELLQHTCLGRGNMVHPPRRSL